MVLQLVFAEVDGHISLVHIVMVEIVLDVISFIAAAYNKLIETKVRINFHNMPQDRLSAYLNHRLWLEVRFFGNARAETSSEYYNLHGSGSLLI